MILNHFLMTLSFLLTMKSTTMSFFIWNTDRTYSTSLQVQDIHVQFVFITYQDNVGFADVFDVKLEIGLEISLFGLLVNSWWPSSLNSHDDLKLKSIIVSYLTIRKKLKKKSTLNALNLIYSKLSDSVDWTSKQSNLRVASLLR